ncbi:MAG: hypothetical protein RBS07_03205 [Lentimicrobium sp.]|jgi:hypothetical protein|nr:hypothetical protein [Lentimicrobium sp.]
MKCWLSYFFSLLIVLVSLISCQDEDEYIPPPVTIIVTPVNDQLFAFGDTLFIQARFSHFRNMATIKVSLVNSSLSPVLPAMNFDVFDTDYLLNTYLLLDDISLSDGEYFIQLKIQDETSSWNEWIDVKYVSVDKQFISVVAVVSPQVNTYDVCEGAIEGNSLKLFSFSGDHCASGLNSASNTFFTVGQSQNGLTAWNLNTSQLLWNASVVFDPVQYWIHGFYDDENEVFVSNRNGFIEGYDILGRVSFRSQQFQNGFFTKILRSTDKLLGIFEPYNSSFRELVIFNYPGGTLFRSLQINGEVLEMSNYSKDVVLLFVNQPERALVYEYSLNSHTLVELKTFSFQNIRLVSGKNAEPYFILTGDEVWWYRPLSNSSTLYLKRENIVGMAFEELSNTLFVASGQHILGYGLPNANPVFNVELPSPVITFNLRYNK